MNNQFSNHECRWVCFSTWHSFRPDRFLPLNRETMSRVKRFLEMRGRSEKPGFPVNGSRLMEFVYHISIKILRICCIDCSPYYAFLSFSLVPLLFLSFSCSCGPRDRMNQILEQEIASFRERSNVRIRRKFIPSGFHGGLRFHAERGGR